MSDALKVSLLGFILAVLCAASVRAEDVKINCVHIGNTTICTKN